MKHAAALVAVGGVLVSAGCGGSHAFVSATKAIPLGSLRLVVSMPRSPGPGLGPAHPFFVDSRRGYLATTGGAWYVPKTGFAGPLAAAEIDATADGGQSWRVLLRAPHAVFDAISVSGRFGYAVGEQLRAGAKPRFGASIPQVDSSFLVATSDGGTTWMRRAGPFPAKPIPQSVPGATPVALQSYGAVVYAELDGQTKRSDDAARHWSAVPLPAGATLVRFASARVGYAAASAGCRGGEMLWRTRDRGGKWHPVGGSCGLPFTDIEAHGRLVATAQAAGFEQGLRDRSLIRLSSDGGNSWRLVADERDWRAVAYVSFTDPERGFVVSAENDQGFEYVQLHVTSDGGRSWRLRAAPFAPVTNFGPAPTQPAFDGQSIWAGEPQDGLLWESRDLGRSWTVSTRPQYIGVQRLLAVHERTLVAVTDTGTVESTDSGANWQPIHHLTAREAAELSGAHAYLGHVGGFLNGMAFLRVRGSWRHLHPPTLGAGAVAFTSAHQGAVASGQGEGYGRTPVAVTGNAGRSWRTVRVPRGVKKGDHAVLGPNVIALVESPTLYVSLDNGSHWHRLRVPRSIFDCNAANYSGNVWLVCPGPGSGPTTLLRSEDGGKTWTSRRAPILLTVTPVSADDAWAVGGNTQVVGQQSLWHTTNGGKTWQPVRVTVSPAAAVPVPH